MASGDVHGSSRRRGPAAAPRSRTATTSITRPTRANPARSRVLLVRQPVKRVDAAARDEAPDRTRLTVIIVIAAAAGAWLLGHLGHRLGFAPLIRVPQLADDPIGAFTTATRMLLVLPAAVIEAGLSHPGWLMLGYALVAIPGGALGAARIRPAGGPRPRTVVVVFANLGAAAAIINAALLVWWTAGTARGDLLRELPMHATGVEAWALDLRAAAGLDLLALVIGVLWLILAVRLPIARWLRAITLTITIFALAVVGVALATSSAAAAEARAPRSLCMVGSEDEPQTRLLLGTTPRGQVFLHRDETSMLIEVGDADGPLNVIGTESIVEFGGE